ncbi:hypothetical protein VP01_5679g1 [Puccinia sorghi]|uniref:Uncharacterized protein n=1 Tax=Puccinia sorghi TaxID=27349 RepID=A0A0L6UIV4_9BASI|nr:hypothetical protein VP01_5679g1 [Puccinia sorghi]
MANVRNHVFTPRHQELKKLFELEKSCHQVEMIQSRNFQMDVRSFDKRQFDGGSEEDEDFLTYPTVGSSRSDCVSNIDLRELAEVFELFKVESLDICDNSKTVRALVANFNLYLPHWTTLLKNKAIVCGNKLLSLRLKDILPLIKRVWTSTSYLNLRSGVRNSQWQFECKWCPFQENISISTILPNCSMELWLYLFSSIHFMGNCMKNASDLEILDMSLGKTSNFGFHILFHTIWIKIFQNGFPVADLFANIIWGEGWRYHLLFGTKSSFLIHGELSQMSRKSFQTMEQTHYYCSLGGLPSSETNQQYNCHFLSTSNTAGDLN